MFQFLVSPFLLGLSVGIYCFSYCLPFAAPLMVTEEKKRKENFFIVLKFIIGRFFGYLAFGALFGYLGQKINNLQISLFINGALIALSLFLIIHALGLMGPKYFPFCERLKRYNNKLPFLMGFLMGVNVCPPFLMSVAYVFNLKSVFLGMVYFLMFFLATSIYFLPLFFLGFLNKLKAFQKAARLAALMVGVLFFIYGVYYIIKVL